MVPLSFQLKEGGEEVWLSPYVYIASLWEKIAALLDQNERYIYMLIGNTLATCIYRPACLHCFN